MSKAAKVENLYELLKVSPESSFADIHAAYQTARSAFSKDSSATYSLFSPQETKEILEKLDQAYFTLSSVEKRTEYNKALGIKVVVVADPHPPKKIETTREEAPIVKAETSANLDKTVSSEIFTVNPDVTVNGAVFIAAREKKGLTLEDVARITKIPMRVLKAIETDDSGRFPAKVYLQGFVKNICHLYKIDTSNGFVAKYLAFAETLSPTTSLKK